MTQSRIDLYWHKKKYITSLRRVSWEKKSLRYCVFIITLSIWIKMIQCLHIIQSNFCLHKWLLKFPAWSALLSLDNIIIETTPYGASSVHLKIKINDVVDVYQYEESETFIDWLCLPKYKITPFRNTLSEKVDMYQPISF